MSWSSLPTFVSHEPVLWIGLIDALIILAVTFGVPISHEQLVAVDGFLAAVGLIITRQTVTPNARVTASAQNVVVEVPAPVVPPAPPAPGA